MRPRTITQRRRRDIVVESQPPKLQSSVGATSSDAAPTGLVNVFGARNYKDVAPTVLSSQRRIVSELDALQAEVDALKRLPAETAAELAALHAADPRPVYVVPNFHPASCGWLTDWSTERNYCANSYFDHLDRVRDDANYSFALSECNNLIAMLNFRPDRIPELKQRLREGRVELCNAFFRDPRPLTPEEIVNNAKPSGGEPRRAPVGAPSGRKHS